MTQILDGFWLPKHIRQEILTPETPWITLKYKDGRPTESDGPGVAGARWPKFSTDQWVNLLKILGKTRTTPPKDFFIRLDQVLRHLSTRFNDPSDPLNQVALDALTTYTGYSREMIQFVLGSLDLMPVQTLEKITRLCIPNTVRDQFIAFSEISDLDGRVRLYESKPRIPIQRWFEKTDSRSIKSMFAKPDIILGYAAGNVIGTSHLISLLGQVSAFIENEDRDSRFPVILVKNSRQEPIFTPLILSVIEEVDPELVSSIAIMIWDYENHELQEFLIAQADLVIAAAADFTIDQIDEAIQTVQTPTHPIRFHRHGHKVSFTAIATPYLTKLSHVNDEIETIHLTTFLAAIDSIFWDQYGCLSSRVHFVEYGNSEQYSPQEYGDFLAEKIRMLSTFLPRGKIPIQGIHNRFEKYAAISASGKVHICSTFDDDFLVVVDERPWSSSIFQSVVNDCIERTIIVRSVEDISEVPERYLGWLPAQNLQSMSVAIDGPQDTTWSPKFTQFCEAIGKCGVTAIRNVGRGAFPQLVYSWDGYLPLDLSIQRPQGYFTTVEFENNYQKIMETHELFNSRFALIN